MQYINSTLLYKVLLIYFLDRNTLPLLATVAYSHIHKENQHKLLHTK
ncbi:hypothetical protein SAMN06265337_2098 [Hymenobacter gelipurpurascens]|uniref:Uncharacterized protein n=1 Tax=Hymenobacter gelipurpurascens TaxID=89968 RepID=A0A212TPC2_9BACT|nr:hypothetical protein SAMN06265337_2098 [Hymenobacter gelipurpurascens]